MESIGIIDLNDNKQIDPKVFFGKDTKAITKACRQVMRNWLHPYAGCYRGNHPTFHELRKALHVPEGSKPITEYRKVVKEWYVDHPDEAEKRASSRKAWEEQCDKQFRIIYGIAKRHGLRLVWHGNGTPCCGDKWTIYKKNKPIARICCL